jgi:predicted HicB family RNase H-like nuclease
MTYKGYEADVQFDEEARLFHGEIVNIPRDVITFQGSSVNDLVQAFHDSVDDYLEICASR